MFLIDLLKHEIKLSTLHRGDSILVIIFFLITITLFPLGIGPSSSTLSKIAPGIIWIMTLLTSIISLDRLFSDDLDDGTIEMYVSQKIDYLTITFTKIITHWITTGIPVLIMAPLLGIALQMPLSSLYPLVFSLLIGTPILSLIGSFGSALTLNAKHRGILTPLIVLPLNIPVLIFGAGCVQVEIMNFNPNSLYLVLLGFLLITLALCPIATSVVLKMSVES